MTANDGEKTRELGSRHYTRQMKGDGDGQTDKKMGRRIDREMGRRTDEYTVDIDRRIDMIEPSI